jgi:hypothetical protein
MTKRLRLIATSLFALMMTSTMWLGCSESLTDFAETEVDDALIA